MAKKKGKSAATQKPSGGATPVFQITGKMSTFGGPDDHGMGVSEGVALFTSLDLTNPRYSYLFLPAPPPGTSGLGRRLNPAQNYLACRWDYGQTSKKFLRDATALLFNPQNGRSVQARPVDWGPNSDTHRVADLSPGAAAALGLNTDDFVDVTILGGAPAAQAAVDGDSHGSSNPHPKPVIKQFIESPNHSARNGARIEMVVLHCTEGSLQSALNVFSSPAGRQVSVHYLIDRNGDIYQLVRDSDRANHCKGANAQSIGIEHVGRDSDSLDPRQSKASASLVGWLLEQYDVPRAQVYGHDFAPGRLTDTSCPDKLFGPAHTQEEVAGWVTTNVV